MAFECFKIPIDEKNYKKDPITIFGHTDCNAKFDDIYVVSLNKLLNKQSSCL